MKADTCDIEYFIPHRPFSIVSANS